MRYQRPLLLLVLLIAVLIGVIFWLTREDTTTSPLLDIKQVQQLQQTWKADLYLPSDLQGTPYLREIKGMIEGKNGQGFYAEMDLLIRNSTKIGQLRIEVMETKRKQVTHILEYPLDEIQKIKNSEDMFKYSNGHFGKVEPVEVLGGTGYWYVYHQGHYRGPVEQRIEFIADGYSVGLSINLLENELPKEQLIAIANSFHEFKYKKR